MIASGRQNLSKQRVAGAAGMAAAAAFIGIDASAVDDQEKAVPKQPNIVIIYADDLGYGDAHCYNPDNGRIPTPNIDRLATEGMKFTDAHSSSAVCSPSRYTLLTGRYHWRTKALQGGLIDPHGKPAIGPERLTIAGLARENGYRTAAVGKWHIGWNWPVTDENRRFFFARPWQKGADHPQPKVTEAHRQAWRETFPQPITGGPVDVGFDYYFGVDGPNWPPYCFIENRHTVGIPSEFMEEAAGGKLEFERYPHLVSVNGPALKDWKLEEVLPTLTDRSVQIIQDAAAKKQPFMLYFSMTSPHNPIVPNEPWKGKSGLNPYADFVMETDAMVGRVLDAIQDAGIADETLVVFASDNGASKWVKMVKDLEKMGHDASGGLRGYKWRVWEGGHRLPLIVRWPGVVEPGTVNDRLVHQADLLATMADIFEYELPDDAGEDSVSILPLLRGDDKDVREYAVSCGGSGMPGIRDGAWKLILGTGQGFYQENQTPADWELYNLAEDPTESNNLAARYPERVTEMKAQLDEMIRNGRSTPGEPQRNEAPVRFGKPRPKGDRTFYIDPKTGDDQADGMTAATAWRSATWVNLLELGAGDRILLRAGTSLEGQLVLNGSGSAEKPALLAGYGKGERPEIAGQGRVSPAVLVDNVSHLRIRELVITKHADEPEFGRSGLIFNSYRGDAVRDIVVENLHVHHVAGTYDRGGGAGIQFRAGNNPTGDGSWFEDIRVENCHLHHLPFNALQLHGWGLRQRDADDNLPFASRNVTFRGNLVHDVDGDAINVINAANVLIEHNEVIRSSYGQVKGKPDAYSVTIWPHSTDDCIVRWNRVSGLRGRMDGQAFDIDINSRRTLFERNWSEDNKGGFMLVCSQVGDSGPTLDSVVRENLSIHDGNDASEGTDDRLVYMTGIVNGVRFDNNVFLQPDSRRRRPHRSHPLRDAQAQGRHLGRARPEAKVHAAGGQRRHRALTV